MWIITLGVAPFVLGMAGQVAQKLILGPNKPTKVQIEALSKWKKVYHVTIPWHALLVGALIGLVGFPLGIPVPPVFGEAIGGAVLAYAFSGGVSIIGYDTIVKTLKRILESYKGPSEE